MIPLRLPLITAIAAAVFALATCGHAQSEPSRLREASFPLDGLHYRCVGPSRGGRVTAVAGVAQRPGRFFMGTTGGGVWRTTDYGASWHNVSDGAFASPSIGAIRAAPSDPDTIWVGTGSDGLRSNVILGCGVYCSTDGGDSWEFMGLPRAGQIGAIEIHPHNPNVVYVAAMGNPFAPNEERGLYRTIDAGVTWQRVLHASAKTGAVDVELCPGDPLRVYACMYEAERKPWTIRSGGTEGGVHRSTDGGNTWQKLAAGLPDGIVGKSDLAVTKADPSRVYVLIEAPGDDGGLYVSFDGGESFMQTSNARNVRARPFYYTNVDVSPADPEVVFVSATRFLRSDDGGRTWRSLRTPHGDHHELWIHPDRPSLWVQGNDGGASITHDDGATWSTLHNQPTAELYQVAIDSRFPYWLYAGQQDNSTIRVPAFPPGPSPAGPVGLWQSVGGCETGPAVPSPSDPDIVYANCKGRFGVFNARTGQEQRYDVGAANMYGHNPRDLKFRFQRVSPIHVSPHGEPETVYHASQYVHKTTDRGRTWTTISPDLTANEADKQVISGAPITRDITGEEFYSCLYALRESTLEAGVIWVGSNDGPIHVTRDGGETWMDVTPPDLPPGGRVQTVEPSPHQKGKAYVAVLRYQLGDWRPHVFRTDDYGARWTRLTTGDNGIPADWPTRVVREDPAREGLLYCGTEWGMFVSFDDGLRWTSMQLDLPITPVTDIAVHPRGDLVLSTMGRSFWILDDLTPLRAWPATATERATKLFDPRPAVRLRYRAARGAPEYPALGANIDYWLESDLEADAVSLEILATSGEVVREFGNASADNTAQRIAETNRMEQIETRVERKARLPHSAGHHRFAWDLRHAGTGPLVGSRGGRRGPLVEPGTYTIRLRIGTERPTTLQTSIDVRLDPRVVDEGVTPEEVAQQIALQRRVHRALTRAAALARSVESADTDASRDVHAALVTAAGDYPQPRLIDQLIYLDGLLGGADQAPGRDAIERCAELEAELDRLERRVK